MLSIFNTINWTCRVNFITDLEGIILVHPNVLIRNNSSPEGDALILKMRRYRVLRKLMAEILVKMSKRNYINIMPKPDGLYTGKILNPRVWFVCGGGVNITITLYFLCG